MTCDGINEDIYIVFSYPKYYINEPIEELVMEVMQINIENRVSDGVCGYVYLQDIVVTDGKGHIFRTCSAFVKRV